MEWIVQWWEENTKVKYKHLKARGGRSTQNIYCSTIMTIGYRNTTSVGPALKIPVR